MRARANTEGDPVILFLSDEISGMYIFNATAVDEKSSLERRRSLLLLPKSVSIKSESGSLIDRKLES